MQDRNQECGVLGDKSPSPGKDFKYWLRGSLKDQVQPLTTDKLQRQSHKQWWTGIYLREANPEKTVDEHVTDYLQGTEKLPGLYKESGGRGWWADTAGQ